jgi:hypothetical protein
MAQFGEEASHRGLFHFNAEIAPSLNLIPQDKHFHCHGFIDDIADFTADAMTVRLLD